MRLKPFGFKWHLSLLYVKMATVLVFNKTVTDRSRATYNQPDSWNFFIYGAAFFPASVSQVSNIYI